MAKANKTTETEVSVAEFIDSVDNPKKQADSLQLVSLMSEWTGCEPKMWGPTIIGFGRYNYTYESGHSGSAPLLGFSPRKAEFSLYVYHPTEENIQLLERLGKFKMGKACIYIKKLEDIDISVLEGICRNSICVLTGNSRV